MVKVAVLGAAGGIGQPLSLLLKHNHSISHLSLYDIVNVRGVAADLAHINTKSKVTAHLGQEELAGALSGAHVVVIPAGVPRKPGMTRDDLFKINAGIVKQLAESCVANCPSAFILIISNPVNSTVPIFSEVFKKAGVYDPKRIFGVTTLDVIRASRFVHDLKEWLDPENTKIPIVGGHSGNTIVPLFSQMQPPTSFQDEEIKSLTNRVQFGGDEVVKAKDGAGSATLSMAFAAARFVNSILLATVGGKTDIVEPTYVSLEADPTNAAKLRPLLGDVAFFSLQVKLGSRGAEEFLPLEPISDYEKELLSTAVNSLKTNIASGVSFIQSSL